MLASALAPPWSVAHRVPNISDIFFSEVTISHQNRLATA